jgi:uncharacterized RDD family membrane protein YckC
MTAQAATTTEAPTFPAASLDRRFYAFAIDRLIGWPLLAAAVFAAYWFYFSEERIGAGIAVIAGAVVVLWLAMAALLGLMGVSPGKALLGLRVVHLGSGTPIGMLPALLRTFIVGASTLPTFGLGLAALAWTAVMDPGHQRRGWHDNVTSSIVVDVRPVPVEEEEVDQGPRHVVNLTAMRLVPAEHPEPVAAPARPARPTPTPAPTPEPLAPTGGWPGVLAPPPPTEPPAEPAAERTRPRAQEAAPPRWRVTFDDGATFVVDGLALVGRRPEPRPGEHVQHLVPLRSEDMSLSKTHAQFHVATGGELVVMDRGSTNGSVLVRKGMSRELTAGRPATLLPGDRVRFGDRTMTVARES